MDLAVGFFGGRAIEPGLAEVNYGYIIAPFICRFMEIC